MLDCNLCWAWPKERPIIFINLVCIDVFNKRIDLLSLQKTTAPSVDPLINTPLGETSTDKISALWPVKHFWDKFWVFNRTKIEPAPKQISLFEIGAIYEVWFMARKIIITYFDWQFFCFRMVRKLCRKILASPYKKFCPKLLHQTMCVTFWDTIFYREKPQFSGLNP